MALYQQSQLAHHQHQNQNQINRFNKSQLTTSSATAAAAGIPTVTKPAPIQFAAQVEAAPAPAVESSSPHAKASPPVAAKKEGKQAIHRAFGGGRSRMAPPPARAQAQAQAGADSAESKTAIQTSSVVSPRQRRNRTTASAAAAVAVPPPPPPAVVVPVPVPIPVPVLTHEVKNAYSRPAVEWQPYTNPKLPPVSNPKSLGPDLQNEELLKRKAAVEHARRVAEDVRQTNKEKLGRKSVEPWKPAEVEPPIHTSKFARAREFSKRVPLPRNQNAKQPHSQAAASNSVEDSTAAADGSVASTEPPSAIEKLAEKQEKLRRDVAALNAGH